MKHLKLFENFDKVNKSNLLTEKGHFNLRELMSIKNMNFTDSQIDTLEGIVNLIHADRDFCEKVYPSGNSASDIIDDMRKVIGNYKIGDILDQMSGGNPIKWVNKFKGAILKNKK
jgi:hypothetical protein